MNLKGIIKTVAPFIGTMLGGPLAGTALKLLGDAFLGDENASQADIEKAVANATPEQFIKLKELSAQTEQKMIAADVDIEKIHAADRDSARDRQKETRDNTPNILALLLTLGFFGLLFCVAFLKIQPDAKDILEIMIGTVGSVWLMSMTYFFGSSAGSKVKTMIMGKER